MKRHWDEQELADHWSLTPDEFELLTNRTERSRLGFATLLKFLQVEGCFASVPGQVSASALDHLASQLAVAPEVFSGYDLAGCTAKRDRVQIRERLGFRQVTMGDAREFADWLRSEILPVDHQAEHLREAALDWCRSRRIEPPTPARMERLIRSAFDAYEKAFFVAAHGKIPLSCCAAMDELLRTTDRDECTPGSGVTPFAELRADPRRVGLESVLREIAKLERIASLGLPEDQFLGVSSKVLQKDRFRVASEQPREVRMHAEAVRHTLVAAFCWNRRKEIIDGLIDLLIQVVHRIGARAEKKVVETLLEDFRKVHGKATLLFKVAEASIDNPHGIIKEVVYPVVGEQTLRDLVREFQSTGPVYQKKVYTTLRSSYGNHYRRMLPPLLDAFEFRSNNIAHRPIIEALELLKARPTERASNGPSRSTTACRSTVSSGTSSGNSSSRRIPAAWNGSIASTTRSLCSRPSGNASAARRSGWSGRTVTAIRTTTYPPTSRRIARRTTWRSNESGGIRLGEIRGTIQKKPIRECRRRLYSGFLFQCYSRAGPGHSNSGPHPRPDPSGMGARPMRLLIRHGPGSRRRDPSHPPVTSGVPWPPVRDNPPVISVPTPWISHTIRLTIQLD